MKPIHIFVVFFSSASLLPCTAQTSTVPASVSIKADLVLIKNSDVDVSHINFVTVSTSFLPNQSPAVPVQALLQYAAGYPVTLLHQRLIQKTPITEITETLFSPPAVSTPSNIPVTITLDEAVPNALQPDLTTAFPASLPHVKQVFQLQGSLTFTPHINPNKSITLSFTLPPDPSLPQTAKASTFLLRPIAAGDVLMMRSSYLMTGASLSLSSPVLLGFNRTLLIFITPTLVVNNK